MSKAEEFIKSKTRIGSNTTNGWRRKGAFIPSYSLPWLTPDQARKAVEIAREETTEKIKQLLKENYLIKSVKPLRWVSWEKIFNDLKQAMQDE